MPAAPWSRGDLDAAADNIQDAQRHLQDLARQAGPGVSTDLEASAIAMGDLAPLVRNGSIASVVQLDSAMAITDYAMARWSSERRE